MNRALFSGLPSVVLLLVTIGVKATEIGTVGVVFLGLLAFFSALFFQQSFSIADRVDRARSESAINAEYQQALDRLLTIANYASMVCIVGVAVDLVPVLTTGIPAVTGLFVAGWLAAHMIMLALNEVSYMHTFAKASLRSANR